MKGTTKESLGVRRYTAQDMREMALVEESYGWDVVAKMLRRAADDLESKKKRKRKYEYAVKYTMGSNGRRVWKSSYHYESIKLCKKAPWPLEGRKFIRREVGAWEEVE